MSYSKLTGYLAAFEPQLVKKLGTYIHCGYFNVSPAAVMFFDYLEPLYPNFKEEKLKEEVIRKKVPGLKNKKAQDNAASDLVMTVQHFLALEQWNKDTAYHPLLLIKAQKELRLNAYVDATFEKFEKQLQKNTEKDIAFFEQKHLFTELQFNGFEARQQRNPDNDLNPVTDTLDEFYALKKLRYQCEILSRHQVLGTPFNPENVDELLQILKPYSIPDKPYVYLCVNIYHMLWASTFTEGQQYYSRLKAHILKQSANTLTQGIKETVFYLINYCLYWNNKGYDEAGANALQWHEFKMEHGLLPENGLLQPADFRNIVSLAILHKKNEKWLKKFIDDYSLFMPKPDFAHNRDFALAQYYYYTGRHDLAMPLFQKAETKKEPILNMIIRRAQFACIYEQNENNEILHDFVIAWKRQLHRTGAALHQLKPVFGRVINYSEKLLAAREPRQKKVLQAALNNEPFFAGKSWLLQQLQK